MADRIPISKPDGSVTYGVEVDMQSSKENWNEYALEDGTRLRLKVVVQQVVRLEDRNPGGEPIYVIKSMNILDARVPDILKARGNN